MKTVVVHRGARDHYQVARALDERGALDTLVTDLYWPAQRPWARVAERMVPASIRRALRARTAPGLDARRVTRCAMSGTISQAATMMPGLSFSVRRRLVRWTDHTLGREAQRIASSRNAAILSYSYYAYAAFTGAPAHLPRILFQLHPHPASVRTILRRELARHPECAVSLGKEWELALPEEDYRRLVDETRAAHAYIVASSFTRQTMIENGLPANKIAVVPYGVDLDWFTPADRPARHSGPLRLLFVGTITQRKGIRYLVEALEQLATPHVQLTVCGRVIDDLAALRSDRLDIDIRPDVSALELRRHYQAADAFVLPSLVEGFGHVLLEAMASGLPVITTTSSAGPDLVRQRQDGLVVPPADSSALAEALQWCLDNRTRLAAMRHEARARAELFSWAVFRTRLANVVEQYANVDAHRAAS